MTARQLQPRAGGRPWSLQLLIGLSALSAGCLVPSAQPAAPHTPVGELSREVVLVRQAACDTAVETATRPLASACSVVVDSLTRVGVGGSEFLGKRLVLPLCGSPGPLPPDRPFLDPARLEAELHQATGTALAPACVEIDLDGAEALRRVEALIDGAACHIDVLVYLWDSDALGWSLAQRLARKAVQLGGESAVRVLVDGGGNLIHGPPDRDTCGHVNEVLGWLAEQPGVSLLRTRNGFARFDHRKLMVVDDRVAWSGGRNFTVASFFEYHDLSYSLRGPLVANYAAGFEKAWKEAGGKPRPHPTDGHSDEFDLPWNARARVVRTEPFRHDLAAVVHRSVDHARHHVWVENPYFSDAVLWCKLVRARKRGVDVRVVYAENSQSDVLDRAMRVTANRLLKAGIRVYRYPGTTHVKAMSVDGSWAYTGTGNFDNLSLRRNHEVGLAIGAGPLIDEIEERLFEADFRPEWELTEPVPVDVGDYACELLASLIF